MARKKEAGFFEELFGAGKTKNKTKRGAATNAKRGRASSAESETTGTRKRGAHGKQTTQARRAQRATKE